MIVHVPCVATHWGDWVTALWASEMLSVLDPSIEQSFDPVFYEQPDRGKPSSLLEHIEIPWVKSFVNMDVKHAAKKFDKVLSTHHRHCHKRSMYEGLHGDSLLFFDAHGISFKCITDDWYPTFNPTKKLQDEFDALGLPELYNVIHLNEPLNDVRFTRSASEFLTLNVRGIQDWSQRVQLVSTSCNVPNACDLSKLHGWLKIMVMVKAHDVWASHTGFTSIASMYRRRRNVTLVNEYGIGIMNLGPPPICYSNYDVMDAGSLDGFRLTIDVGHVPEAIGDAYRLRSLNAWRNWYSFEMFPHISIQPVPQGYSNKKLHLDSENCIVPVDASFGHRRDDGAWDHYDFVNDKDELTSISRIVLDPKQFEKYH